MCVRRDIRGSIFANYCNLPLPYYPQITSATCSGLTPCTLLRIRTVPISRIMVLQSSGKKGRRKLGREVT